MSEVLETISVNNNSDPHAITNPPNAVGLGNTDSNYTYPYKISSGTMRGTQNVGAGGAQVDSANNRIVLNRISSSSNSSASATVGQPITKSPTDQSFGLNVTDVNGNTLSVGILPDGTLGLLFTDSSGFVLRKITFDQDNFYDKVNNVNIMRSGALPDKTYGWVVAANAKNVVDGF